MPSRFVLALIFIIFSFIGYSQSENYHIGEITFEQLNDKTKYVSFSNIYERYKVDTLSLKNIKGNVYDLEFRLFIGVWCPDSKVFAPKLLKVLNYLGVQDHKISIIAVNRQKNKPVETINTYNIKYVPTLIIYRDSKEVNRIVEYVNKSIEKDLYDIIVNKEYVPFQ